MNRLSNLIPELNFFEMKKDVLPVSKEDLYLFSSGLFSFGAGALESLGYSSWGLRSLSNLTNMMGEIGESATSVRTIEEAHAATLGIALAGAKMIAYSKMHSYPSLKPLLVIINAYGAYAVAQRAYSELNKCYEASKTDPKGELSWNIVRNVFIHGVNAAFSAYKIYDVYRHKITNIPDQKTRGTSKFQLERQQTLAGITKLMSPNAQSKSLNKDTLACRVLFYDPSCSTLDTAQSDCSPSCNLLSKSEIDSQYDLIMRKTYLDKPKDSAIKVYKYIENARDTLLNLAKEREENAQIKQKKIKATKLAVAQANSILLKKEKSSDYTEKSQQSFNFVRNYFPSANDVIEGISSDRKESIRAKSIKRFNDDCKDLNSKIHVDKNPSASPAEKRLLHDANAIINGNCDKIRDLNANFNQVNRIITLRKTSLSNEDFACKIYSNFCKLLRTHPPALAKETKKAELSAKNLLDEIGGSLFDRITSLFQSRKPIPKFKNRVLNSLKTLKAQSKDLSHKIIEAGGLLNTLEATFNERSSGNLHLQLSTQENPFSPHKAQTAYDMVVKAEPLLEKQYTAVKRAFQWKMFEIEQMKDAIDNLYGQLNRIKTEQKW